MNSGPNVRLCGERSPGTRQEWGRHLLQARDLERASLSLCLHDDIAQRLAGIKWSLLAAGAGSSPLGDTVSRLDEVMDVLRSLSQRLHPDTLRDIGVVAALRALVESFGTDSPLAFQLGLPAEEPEVPSGLAETVYRIAEEAMANASRHSGAAVAYVGLSVTGGELRLVVSDNGAGFDPDAGREAGWGLVEMAERAASTGGDLRIGSAAGIGTRVSCAWRLPEPVPE